MSDPVAVLVVPAEGDPGGLLAWGRCGSAPAVAHRWNILGRCTPWEARSGDGEQALPLWWDGALVPEGWDRAQRVAIDADALDDDLFHVTASLGEVADFAAGLADAGLASRVVLLDRIDGRLVERA